MSDYDHDNNSNDEYDDFIMSDEEDLESISKGDNIDDIYNDNADSEITGMELENDEVGDENNDSNSNQFGSLSMEKHLMELYSEAKNMKYNDDYNGAIEKFNEIIKVKSDHKVDVRFSIKALKQIIKTIVLRSQTTKQPPNIAILIDQCRNLLIFISNHFSKIEESYIEKSLYSILNTMTPVIYKGYIFDIDHLNTGDLLNKLKSQEQILKQFHFLMRNFKDILNTDTIEILINVKKYHIYMIIDILSIGNIDLGKYKIKQGFQEIHLLTKESDVLFAVNLYLQYFIYEFIETRQINEIDEFRCCLQILEKMKKQSFSITQNSAIMVLYHFGRALYRVLFGICTDINCDAELVNFFDNIHYCELEFRACLKNLEELGSRYCEYHRPFQWLVMSGYIFSNIILYYNNDDYKINPFELEQLKVVRGFQTIIELETVYDNFVDLNLKALANSMEKLPSMKSHWHRLVAKIYHLAIVTKLWTQIAPIYECISIDDLRNLLELSSELRLSRDELLGILMKSITEGNKSIYFKLDLNKDLVYFGTKYNVPMSNYTIAKFNSNKKITHLFYNDLELATDIGVTFRGKHFDTKQVLTRADFFQKLKRANDESCTDTKNNATNIQSPTAYNMLSELIEFTSAKLHKHSK